MLDECDRIVGLDRLGSLHLNDSVNGWAPTATATPTSARARSARTAARSFLSEPRFETLPVILETPGPDKKGTPPEEIALARKLRKRGMKARG